MKKSSIEEWIVDRCKRIVADVRMEECYANLSLFIDPSDEEAKKEIYAAIEKVSKQLKIKPSVIDNQCCTLDNKEEIIIEFDDEVQREAGEFFELLLRELGIDRCEDDHIT